MRFAAVLACLIGLTGPVAAQTTALKHFTLREDLLGWEAIGRLEIGRTGYCTGVLIAPDLVLTAAHCLVNEAGQRRNVDKLEFRAGLQNGRSVADARVARAVLHKRYQPMGGTSARNLSHDVALLQLVSAIPSATAAPFGVGVLQPNQGQVSVVSYAAGRDQAPARQAECNVLGRRDTRFAFDCDVTFGASGAPVFASVGSRPQIVSLISQGRREGRDSIAFGMDLSRLVDDLKLALRSGEGVFPRAVVQAKRLKVGGASGGGGAKFVRP